MINYQSVNTFGTLHSYKSDLTNSGTDYLEAHSQLFSTHIRHGYCNQIRLKYFRILGELIGIGHCQGERACQSKHQVI